MPKIPQQVFEDEIPRFRDQPDGDVLEILNVKYDTTKLNGYECVTVTLKDGSKLFGTDAGVLRSLKAATDEFGTEFTPSDPLKATVSSYVDKFNKTRKSLS